SHKIEPVILGDGLSRPLLRVDQITTVDGKPRPEFDARLWVDSDGQVLKTEQDILGGLVMYRTTEQSATSTGGPIQLDLILASAIKSAKKISNPEQTRQVKYRVVLKQGKPAQVFPSDPRQSVQVEADTSSAILEVKSVGPGDGQPGPDQVDSQFSAANAL